MIWLWFGLLGVLAVLATVEFAFLARRPRIVSTNEALTNTLMWVLFAAAVAIVIYHVYRTNWEITRIVGFGELEGVSRASGGDSATARDLGARMMLQFVTVYVTEMALSLDNIAVLALLFAFYKIPQQQIGRVLFWGVAVSLVVRLGLILLFGTLVKRFDWFQLVFAGLLVVAMVRTLVLPDQRTNFNHLWMARLIRRFAPLARHRLGEGGFVRRRLTGRIAVTPMLLVILIAGGADLSYTADFLPAVFAITREPFIAFTGNALALLTLRSLFFTIAPVMGRFRYLKLTLVFIMLYIAVKTFFFHATKIGEEITLGVVVVTIAVGVVASVLVNRRRGVPVSPVEELRPAPIDDLSDAAMATRRSFRKVMILLAGSAVIIFGLIIAPLPGPGPLVLVPVGIGILATEFVWAQFLLRRMKEQGEALAKTSDRISASIPKWAAVLAVPLWIGVWFGLWWLVREKGMWSKFVMATAFGTSFPFCIWVYRLLRRPK